MFSHIEVAKTLQGSFTVSLTSSVVLFLSFRMKSVISEMLLLYYVRTTRGGKKKKNIATLLYLDKQSQESKFHISKPSCPTVWF